MSKQLKKFRKNEHYSDEEEVYDYRSTYLERKTKRRTERALRTKDISALVEDDELDDFEAYNSTFEEDKL